MYISEATHAGKAQDKLLTNVYSIICPTDKGVAAAVSEGGKRMSIHSLCIDELHTIYCAIAVLSKIVYYDHQCMLIVDAFCSLKITVL